MTGMSSREQDYLARADCAERDLYMVAGLLFRASWERMVLLASTMEYREAHGCALPSPDRDHDIITLEAMLACVMAHGPREPSEMTDEEIQSELNVTDDDERFSLLEEELCDRRSAARLAEIGDAL